MKNNDVADDRCGITDYVLERICREYGLTDLSSMPTAAGLGSSQLERMRCLQLVERISDFLQLPQFRRQFGGGFRGFGGFGGFGM